jgi:cellobiose phosphorylase
VGVCDFGRPADRAAADRDPANIELARQMVQAHAYWRLKGLVVDLVIWYEDQSGYRQRCTTRSWA